MNIEVTEEIGPETLPEIRVSVDMIVAQVAGLVITDDGGMVTAAEMLKKVKGALVAVGKHFTPLKREADAQKKVILDEEKSYTTPLLKGEAAIKRILSAYQILMEAKRAEEQARLEVEARVKAEDRAINAAINTGDETILDEPIDSPIIVVAKPTKVEGVSYLESWKYRVVNLKLVPDEYKVLDESAVGKVVRALKDRTSIPGIEVYAEKTVRAST